MRTRKGKCLALFSPLPLGGEGLGVRGRKPPDRKSGRLQTCPTVPAPCTLTLSPRNGGRRAAHEVSGLVSPPEAAGRGDQIARSLERGAPGHDQLEHSLRRLLGDTVRLLEREPSPYASTFALEILRVRRPGGRVLEVVFKDLGRRRMLPVARRVRPRFLFDPAREIEVYRRILGPAGLGTPACYGAELDERAGRAWLFLERVRGRELYQVGDSTAWKAVARWLARSHTQFADVAADLDAPATARLLEYDERHFLRWVRRAVRFRAGGGAARRRLLWLSRRAARIAGELAAMPRTLVHGQFYASNVLVSRLGGTLRVCPVDWETAGLGPGLLDLAALVSGWDDRRREALCQTYREAAPGPDVDAASFQRGLDLCRLHLAVQWLGWARDWQPPAGHARDWLGEALGLAERLGL